MADINFDGKPDVIFKIDPNYCGRGSSCAAPIPSTIHLSFLSEGNEYLINSRLVNNVAETMYRFNLSTGDGRGHPHLVFIKSISSNDGIVIASGHSLVTEYSGNDATCYPDFVFAYEFDYYIDRYGNGYAEIKGAYANIRESTEQDFEIRFK